MRWAMILPPDHPGDGAVDAVLSLIDGWHPNLRALIETVDLDNSALISIRVVRSGARWPRGPATLLGDAIHATSPSGGNGANTALHDVALLCRKLIDATEGRTPLLTALDEFESQMFVYGTQAVEHSLNNLDTFLPDHDR